jgi:hypothetical protein
MARPTKYEPTRVKRITDALTAGNTRRAASAYGGVSEDTFTRWLTRYPAFAEAVQEAEARAEVNHVANIARAAQNGTWTASAWWLERRRPTTWGREDADVLRIVRDMAHAEGYTEEETNNILRRAEYSMLGGRDAMVHLGKRRSRRAEVPR